jgi:hypothetical protein
MARVLVDRLVFILYTVIYRMIIYLLEFKILLFTTHQI